MVFSHCILCRQCASRYVACLFRGVLWLVRWAVGARVGFALTVQKAVPADSISDKKERKFRCRAAAPSVRMPCRQRNYAVVQTGLLLAGARQLAQ
jgi:hypothetical protein